MDMSKRVYKPDKAGKNYRPKEEKKHVFFFKGHVIMISKDFKDIWICQRKTCFSTNCNTLDDALIKGMEEIYKINEKDYKNTLKDIEKEEKEKQIKRQLEPFISIIINELLTK